MLATMTWGGDHLVLLDQTKLPTVTEYIYCYDYQRVKEAIARLEVRGAPAIGAAAAFAMVLGARRLAGEGFLPGLAAVAADLCAARPTAVNLAWGCRQIYQLAEELYQAGLGGAPLLERLAAKALAIYQEDIAANKRLGDYGAALLPQQAVILTHCNAGALATCGWGTALGVVRSGFYQGRVKMVYSDETRPLLQGARLTAYELVQEGIPVTCITDGMAAWTLQQKRVDCVIVGADRIAANGDTANKIGTLGVALAAKALGVPFYVAAPTSTFDLDLAQGEDIPIEERGAEEVRAYAGLATAPAGALVFNPAFDVTKAELISAVITERGVIRPPYRETIYRLMTEPRQKG